jgi:hypothetical protein
MASAYQFIEPGAGFPGVSNTGTVQLQRLGLICGAHDQATSGTPFGYAEFMYVQGASASAPTAGDAVILSQFSAGQLVSGNTLSQGVCGVAPAALSTTNVFGWVQVMGVCDYAKATNSSISAGQPLFVGTAAGRFHSTGSATGFRVDGAYVNTQSYTSSQSNSLVAFLYYPVYNGR